MNGEPAKTEHAGSFGSNVFTQLVLFTPGPVPVRTKSRLFPPTTNLIKKLPGGVTGRFAKAPVTDGSKFPKLVETLVAIPV